MSLSKGGRLTGLGATRDFHHGLLNDPNGPVLCLVTDRRRLGGTDAHDTTRLLDLIVSAANAGVDLVQIREGDLSDRALDDLVIHAVEVTAGTHTRIVVNDRFDIALSCGASGVHLKSDSVPAHRIRSLVPANWLIGRSIHSVDEGRRVTAESALDYLVLGTVFSTDSKPGRRPIGLGVLRQAVQVLPVPVLAIGGITSERAPEIAQAGAAGLGAIGLFSSLAKSTPQEFRRSVDRIRKRWRT